MHLSISRTNLANLTFVSSVLEPSCPATVFESFKFPYLFSNSVAPAIVGASLEMFKMLKESNALHDKLVENVNYFRDKMMAAGFDIKPTQSAICAVMLYDAKLSQDFAAKMQEEGIYVTGFYYPVVPKGQARIRVQLSAGHETEHLDKAIAAFIKVGKELNVIK